MMIKKIELNEQFYCISILFGFLYMWKLYSMIGQTGFVVISAKLVFSAHY